MSENLDVVEVLAAFDPVGFRFVVESTTPMVVTALRDMDPLDKEVMSEDVESVASFMESGKGLDKYGSAVKKIGESYGYVLSI